jgi:hypothetical protein
MRRDSIFYQLFQQSPALLFQLLENPPVNASSYRFDSVAVKEPKFENGIEGIQKYHANQGRKIQTNTPTKDIVNACVRYADDMVFFLKPEDDATEILDKISQFLMSNKERELRSHEQVTQQLTQEYLENHPW